MKYSLRSLMQFSIRDLFWLTVVVTLAVGWWAGNRRIAEENSRLKEKVEPLIRAQKEAEARFNALRETLESGGFKVHWEQKGDDLKIAIELPNPSTPAPNPPKP